MREQSSIRPRRSSALLAHWTMEPLSAALCTASRDRVRPLRCRCARLLQVLATAWVGPTAPAGPVPASVEREPSLRSSGTSPSCPAVSGEPVMSQTSDSTRQSPPAQGSSHPSSPRAVMEPQEAFAELSRLVVGEQPLGQVLARVADLAQACTPGAEEVSVSLLEGDKAHSAAFTGQLAVNLDERQYE